MKKIELFIEDSTIIEQLCQFKKTDAILAMLLYIYYIGLVLYDNNHVNWTTSESEILLSGLYWVLAVISPILIVLFVRKQSFMSIGISKVNLLKSISLSLMLTIFYFFITLAYSFIVKGQIVFRLNHTVIYYFIYFFIIDSFSQEILFRGFLSLRIRSWIKNKLVSILLVGFMFSLMHFLSALAFQFWDFERAINLAWITMIYTFGFHIVAQLLFQRYNNLVGPIILHGFGNMFALMIIFA
jgi:membrane protease YdiL (CAAX protease family)